MRNVCFEWVDTSSPTLMNRSGSITCKTNMHEQSLYNNFMGCLYDSSTHKKDHDLQKYIMLIELDEASKLQYPLLWVLLWSVGRQMDEEN